MLALGAYVALFAVAFAASLLASPVVWVPCVVLGALLVLRLELLWALGKLVRVRPVKLDLP